MNYYVEIDPPNSNIIITTINDMANIIVEIRPTKIPFYPYKRMEYLP